MDVKYRKNSMNNEVCKRAKEIALAKYPVYKQLERAIIKSTYLSERICAEYLKEHPNEYDQVVIDPESIQIAPDVPADIRARILALIHQYEKVFADKTNVLPAEMKDVEPHKFKLKTDAVPTTVGRPHFGKAQARIIMDWIQWARANDLVEKAPKTAWSSRLVLAPKYKNTTAKNCVPDGIRITWAGTGANEQIQKTVPTYPDA